jgi:hypothetical protein
VDDLARRRAGRRLTIIACACVRLIFDAGPSLAQEAAPAPAEASSHEAESTRVILRGPSGLRLEQNLDSIGGGDWSTVCTGPCDVTLSTDLQYRVAGGGHRASEAFDLRGSPEQAEVIEVHGGSTAGLVVGIVGASVGGAALLAGGALLLFAVTGPITPGPGEGKGSMLSWSDAGTLGAIGAGSVAVGAPLLIGGLALIRANRRSIVSQQVTSADGNAAGLHAWTRGSMGREASAAERLFPRAVAFPVLSGSF